MNIKRLMTISYSSFCILLAGVVLGSSVPAIAGGGTEVPQAQEDLDDEKVAFGDLNGDGQINSDDAIRLLMHVSFPNDKSYAIVQNTDYNKDSQVNSDDAIYLLMHSQFPEDPAYKLESK